MDTAPIPPLAGEPTYVEDKALEYKKKKKKKKKVRISHFAKYTERQIIMLYIWN